MNVFPNVDFGWQEKSLHFFPRSHIYRTMILFCRNHDFDGKEQLLLYLPLFSHTFLWNLSQAPKTWTFYSLKGPWYWLKCETFASHNEGVWAPRFLLFTFFFFFARICWFWETNFTVMNSECIVHALCWHCLRIKKILKMSPTVLFTHLKTILLQCFQFSVFSFSNNKLNPNGPNKSHIEICCWTTPRWKFDSSVRALTLRLLKWLNSHFRNQNTKNTLQ